MTFQKPNSPKEPSFSTPPSVSTPRRQPTVVQVEATPPMSQSSIASFVFGAVQITITTLYVAVIYNIQALLPEASSVETAPSGELPSRDYMKFLLFLNTAGLISLLLALSAFTSIRKGKSGVWLTIGGAGLSFTGLAISYLPVLFNLIGL